MPARPYDGCAPAPLTGHTVSLEQAFQCPATRRSNRIPECRRFNELRPVIVPVGVLLTKKHALQIPSISSEASLLSIGISKALLGPEAISQSKSQSVP